MDFRKHLSENSAVLNLILVNTAICIALSAFPSLSDFFLLDPGIDIAAKRPWTLFTVFFSHNALIHIALNMFLVLVFGTQLRAETSSKTVYAVYVACGLIGSLTILAYAPWIGYDGGPVAGASAAAFGLVSAYAALQPDRVILKSKSKYWAVALFVVNAVLTVQNPRVSVGGPAHAAGIAAGLILGTMLKRRRSAESRNRGASSGAAQ